MNTLEQFIAVYEPQSDRNVGFREMLEKVIQEVKNKAQPTNEVIGMRDYFAAKAMQGMATWDIKVMDKLATDFGELPDFYLAKNAYAIADAMMEARK